MSQETKTWEERFDEKFGKDGIDESSDPTGPMAGCDDCPTSIRIRKEHKEFLIEALTTQKKEILEKVEKAQWKMSKKGMVLDYADRTEYDECADILNPIIQFLRGNK